MAKFRLILEPSRALYQFLFDLMSYETRTLADKKNVCQEFLKQDKNVHTLTLVLYITVPLSSV